MLRLPMLRLLLRCLYRPVMGLESAKYWMAVGVSFRIRFLREILGLNNLNIDLITPGVGRVYMKFIKSGGFVEPSLLNNFICKGCSGIVGRQMYASAVFQAWRISALSPRGAVVGRVFPAWPPPLGG